MDVGGCAVRDLRFTESGKDRMSVPIRGRAVRDLRFLYGNAPPATQGWKGRAVVQPGNGAVLAGFCRFRHDERNMAFSSRGLCS